jgi:hypothetical protein
MSEFSFEAPDPEGFVEALVAMLNAREYKEIADILSGSKCAIIGTDRWTKISGKLYTAHETTVDFAVIPSNYKNAIKLTDEQKKVMMKFSNELIKPEVSGLFVSDVTFTVKMRKDKTSDPEEYTAQQQAFVTYDTSDQLLEEHINEINKTYNVECYTATFMLCRKVLENLIIHSIIKKRYPDKSKEHREKYYDFANNRNLDFSVLLSNLRKSSCDFAPENKLLDRICQLADGFKEDANEMTHSLYHIATKKELDEKGFQDILTLIKRLEDEMGTPKTS